MEKDKRSTLEEKLLRSQRNILFVTLFIDLGSVIPVIVVAWLSKSLILFSDLYDYSYCIISEVISLLIINKIIKGKTTEYDYGPGKLETISSLLTSFLVIIVLGIALYASLLRLLEPVPLVISFAVGGLVLTVVGFFVSVIFWWRSLHLARSSGSPLMEVQWRIHRTSALGYAGTLVSLLAVLLLRKLPWSVYIDPICAIVFTLISGGIFIKLISENFRDLADKTLAEDLQIKILKPLSQSFELYDSFHGVRSRRVGKKNFIEIILGFEPHRIMGEFFDLSGRFKDVIERDIPHSEVRVFVRPVEEYDERLGVSQRLPATIDIIAMSNKTINNAIGLCEKVFPKKKIDFVSKQMKESFSLGTYTAELVRQHIIRPRYWVALQGSQFLGFLGMYFNSDEPDAVWGSYWAVDQSAGISAMRASRLLFRKFVFESRKTGRKYLRVNISLGQDESRVKQLYKNYGFREFKTYIDEFGETVIS